MLKALGAEIVRTPTEAAYAYHAPDSHISVARRLQQEMTPKYMKALILLSDGGYHNI